jgi:hypothetical protein
MYGSNKHSNHISRFNRTTLAASSDCSCYNATDKYYSFDGVADYGYTTCACDCGVSCLACTMSLAIWFKKQECLSTTHRMFSLFEDFTPCTWGLFRVSIDACEKVVVDLGNDSTGTFCSSNYATIRSACALTNCVVYLLVMTYDQACCCTPTLVLYDPCGCTISCACRTHGGTTLYGGSSAGYKMRVAGRNGVGTLSGCYLDVDIYEAGVWNSKLTACNITTLYNCGAGTAMGCVGTPALWYKFASTDTTTTITDASANSYCLTLVSITACDIFCTCSSPCIEYPCQTGIPLRQYYTRINKHEGMPTKTGCYSSKSIEFAGGKHYISSGSAFNFSTVCVSAWVYTIIDECYGTACITKRNIFTLGPDSQSGDTQSSVSFWLDSTDSFTQNRPFIRVHRGDVTPCLGNFFTYYSDVSASDKWTHYFVSATTVCCVRLWIDGKEVTLIACPCNPCQGPCDPTCIHVTPTSLSRFIVLGAFTVGCCENSTYFTGYMDDVAFWFDAVVPLCKISCIYNCGSPVNLNCIPCVCNPSTWYKLGDCEVCCLISVLCDFGSATGCDNLTVFGCACGSVTLRPCDTP